MFLKLCQIFLTLPDMFNSAIYFKKLDQRLCMVIDQVQCRVRQLIPESELNALTLPLNIMQLCFLFVTLPYKYTILCHLFLTLPLNHVLCHLFLTLPLNHTLPFIFNSTILFPTLPFISHSHYCQLLQYHDNGTLSTLVYILYHYNTAYMSIHTRS